LWKTHNEFLSDVLRWWGFRFEDFNLYLTVTSGKVSYFSYSLWVLAPGVLAGVPLPPVDGKLGAVIVGLLSEKIINVRVPNSAVESHPSYRLTPAFGAPSQSIAITLTPTAPREIVRSAFDLRLNCIWSFGGCRRWSQLLPSIEPLPRR
jgi:hypothetical protein